MCFSSGYKMNLKVSHVLSIDLEMQACFSEVPRDAGWAFSLTWKVLAVNDFVTGDSCRGEKSNLRVIVFVT